MQKYFFRVVLILTLLSFYHLKTFSQEEKKEWIYSCSSDKGEKNFVRSTCIYDDDGCVKVWTKEYLKNFKIKGKIYSSITTKQLYKFDFKEERCQLLQVASYNSEDELVDSFNVDAPQWDYITPGTVISGVFETVKELFKN